MNKKIVLLATGGTISSTGAVKEANLSAKLKGEALKRDLPDTLCRNYDIEVIDFSVVNSTALKPMEMIEMAHRINGILSKEDVAGVVVTHGTSLMEETSFVLDMLVDYGEKPVVITGAQRNATYPWPDGMANLNDAFQIVASPKSRGMGVMVTFNGYIFEGFRLRKIHTASLNAFSSGECGPLGTVFFDQINFHRDRVRKHIPFKNIEESSVVIIPFYSGASTRYFESAVSFREQGIVVESVGLGNVNADYYEGIKMVREKGIPVVITSRCPDGHLIPMYAYKGGGASLKELGVFFSNYSSYQARLLLMILLGAGCTEAEMAPYFDCNG